MKQLWKAVGVVVALAVPATALAMSTATGTTVSVPAGETRSGTYFAAGSNITVAGTIDGDLVCAGNNVTVTGTVHGDVICAGELVDISGTVDGSVRVAGQNVTLEGPVGRNVTAFGQAISAKPALAVAGDAGFFGQVVRVDGKVAKDVYGGAQQLTLAGESGKVAVAVGQLFLADSAKVNGDLWYTGQSASTFDHSKVTGTVTYAPVHRPASAEAAAAASVAWRIYWLAASLLTAFVLLALVPHRVRRLVDTMLDQAGPSIGWGAVIVLAGPFTMFLLTLTVIGLPLALLFGVIMLTALYLSPIMAGLAVALWVLHRLNYRQAALWWAALLGVIVASAVIWTPWLGALVWLASLMWVMGAAARLWVSGRAKSSATA
ncbi:MAG TPA: hypothetical protein VI322_01510 [Candidatus Saccharimonadia bacterium]